LRPSLEAGFAHKNGIVHPWLLECDKAGKLLWASQQTREALGNRENPAELMAATQPVARGSRNLDMYPFHVWRVWEAGEAVVLGVIPLRMIDPIQLELMRLESRLLRKLVRLLVRERLLSDSARRRREHRGLTAIRQIELERQRLGRELHTGIGQTMAAILLQLDIVSSEFMQPSARASRALDNIAMLAASALEQVRGVSRKLHPPEWQRLPLDSALRQLWDISGIPNRFDAYLHIDALAQEPVPEIKALLYRGLQEALSNLMTHSKATRVETRLTAESDTLTLTVVDDGVGFDTARVHAEEISLGSGIGLRSIREQVEGVQGNFSIASGPAGTKLVISVLMAPKD